MISFYLNSLHSLALVASLIGLFFISSVYGNCKADRETCLYGNCGMSGATYSCHCWRGYHGDRCERFCSPPCKFGDCQPSGPNQLRCVCYDGFEGGSCERAIDHCAKNNAPCGDHGECTNEQTRYKCICHPAWTGPDCQNRYLCGSLPCMNNGVCSSPVGSNTYSCVCQDGYTGRNCEVELAQNICLPGQERFSPCGPFGVCINHVTEYECVCQSGYAGIPCEDIDECSSGPCQNGGRCRDKVNFYLCECPSEYTGYNCEYEINFCLSQPCENYASCVPGVGHYNCTCMDGYTGIHCETMIDYCLSLPCLNNGTCNSLIDSYTCDCAPGFTGIHCETDIDECSSNPCLNEAVCYDGIAEYNCTCKYGFIGITCEQYDYFNRSMWALAGLMIVLVVVSLLFMDVWMVVLWSKLRLGVSWVNVAPRGKPPEGKTYSWDYKSFSATIPSNIYRPSDGKILVTKEQQENDALLTLLAEIQTRLNHYETLEAQGMIHNSRLIPKGATADSGDGDIDPATLQLFDEIRRRLDKYAKPTVNDSFL